MTFHVPGYKTEVYVKKRWRIVTNSNVFVAASQHLAHPPTSLRAVDFVQCCGKIAKQTARYIPEFARHFWKMIVPNARGLIKRSRKRKVGNWYDLAQEMKNRGGNLLQG